MNPRSKVFQTLLFYTLNFVALIEINSTLVLLVTSKEVDMEQNLVMSGRRVRNKSVIHKKRRTKRQKVKKKPN